MNGVIFFFLMMKTFDRDVLRTWFVSIIISAWFSGGDLDIGPSLIILDKNNSFYTVLLEVHVITKRFLTISNVLNQFLY